MAKLIAKRYEFLFSSDQIIAQDLLAKETVRVHTLKCQKLPDLIHNAFLRRAKELGQLKYPGLTCLVDSGFDQTDNCYYLVYAHAGGKPLKTLLQKPTWSHEWVIQALMEVTDALNFLHLHNVYMGLLKPDNIILDLQGELPLKIADPALLNFQVMLGEVDLENPDPLQQDLSQLGNLAYILLCQNLEPTPAQIEEIDGRVSEPLRQFLQRCRLKLPEPYASVNEARRDLLKTTSELNKETNYYLVPSGKAAQVLHSLGFIPQAEKYLAAAFLNDELQKPCHAKVLEQTISAANGQTIYHVISDRFRLVCKADGDTTDKNLVITNVETPPGTNMVTDREASLSIQATFKVTTQEHIPASAKITGLLEALIAHCYQTKTLKKQQIARKGSVESWSKVLELQKRMLNSFQLAYEDWELADNDSSLWVTLRDEIETWTVSAEEGLMMSAADGKLSIPVGSMEDIEGKRLKISLLSSVDPEKIAKHGKISLDNIQVRSILNRQQDGLRRLRYGESVNPNLLELLTDPATIVQEGEGAVEFWDNDLDHVQKLAVKKSLAARDIFLIHGPPGTGKTRTIVEIVRQVLNSDGHDPKILISSQSNVAVNHALSTLREKQPGLKDYIVRVGREEKAGNTTDLLITHQMKHWLDERRANSIAYYEKEREKFNQPQLAECLGVLDECEKLAIESAKDQIELSKQEAALNEIMKDYETMQNILTRTEGIRNNTSQILQRISSNDLALRDLLENFNKGYLGFAETFLKAAQNAANLSGRRIDLAERIQELTQRLEEQKARQASGIEHVSETLAQLYKVELNTLESQRKYVNDKLAAQQETALRLGRLQKISQDWCQRIGRGSDEFTGAFLSRCKVVGATCIGVAARGEVSEAEFDWVIIDEAGRSTHPELIVPMVRGRKIVLVGDHKQLPPIIDSDLQNDLLDEIDVTREELETSLFEELIGPTQAKLPLQVQYRMHPAIGDLISHCFYEDSLKPGDNVGSLKHGLKWATTPVIWLDTSKQKNHQEKKAGTSFENLLEVQQITKLLDRIESELAPKNLIKSVGVIAGYMAQKRLMRRQLKDASRWRHLQLEIDTVDAYQGREMDFIIYSIVRSNTERKIGFLKDMRRLNVALSRAHELLVIVGDRSTAEMASTGHQSNPFYDVANHIKIHRNDCSFQDATL